MYFPIAVAQTPGSTGPQQALPPITLFQVMLIFIVCYFFLFVIRPQQKKQKEVQKMLSGIQKGDKIITTGGIHGIVANVKDDIVSVKVAENVKIDVSRSCITAVKKEKAESA